MQPTLPDDAERYREAKRLFLDACKVPPEQQAKLVADLAAHDQTLAGMVKGLLAHDAELRQHGPGDPLSGLPFGKVGGRIGPYRIARELGSGAQGVVYLAEDLRLDRNVALKVLDSAVTNEPTALERFRREAEITSRLDHPGICAVYETGEDRGRFWIAMRYVEGESLARAIASARERKATNESSFIDLSRYTEPTTVPENRTETEPTSGPKTWDEIARVLLLFERAAEPLHLAHEHGVIHRDLKPGNIMVAKDGKPVILDFGLAQEIEGRLQTLTLAGPVGTPAYMSPEQIAAHHIRLDRRTDVYSLGVSLYECLTLKRPFDAPTRDGLYQAIMTKDPPDPRELNPALPSDLKVVLEAALEKDRDRRYQTALDFAEDIRRVRMHEPILAKPVGRLVRLRRWSQRNPALATALAALFVVLVTGLAIALILLDETRHERDAKERALKDLEESDRLADVTRLAGLKAIANDLWPAHPEQIQAMRTWVEDASLLQERLPEQVRTLESLRRSGGRPPGEATSWQFEDARLQFRHDTLAKFVTDMATFLNPKKGTVASIRERLSFATSVKKETIGRYETKWADTMRSIADPTECPRYNGFKITHQLGLIPIAKDPASRLWEFAHLQTTAPGTDPIPARGPEGKLVITETTGIVLVLIPGGKLGSVPIEPFFLSKYEMTQGQWKRLTGENPSGHAPGETLDGKKTDLTHPVEYVSWEDCDLWLHRLGFDFPTRAQWEYAARAGTDTPWWSGSNKDSLRTAANVADKSFGRVVGGTWERWDDGYPVHAPVGTFEPNGFGLHHVLGNVFEWCKDCSVPGKRVFRGGAFSFLASQATLDFQKDEPEGNRDNFAGVRPSRQIGDN